MRGALAQVGKKYVRSFNEALEDFTPLFRLYIKVQALFIPIGDFKHDALAAGNRNVNTAYHAPKTLRIPLTALNLDDLRTQVAQNRTRAGSGMKYAVFDNAYAA